MLFKNQLRFTKPKSFKTYARSALWILSAIALMPVILVGGYFIAAGVIALSMLAAPVLLACLLLSVKKVKFEPSVELFLVDEYEPDNVDIQKFIKEHEFDEDIFLAS